MTTVQVTSEMDVEHVIQGIGSLDNAALEQVVSRLSILLAQRKANRLPLGESHLLKKINQGLSTSKQSRYQYLQESLQAGMLSSEEHQELLVISEETELMDANRLQALVELSHLRGIPVDGVMKQLGIIIPMPRG